MQEIKELFELARRNGLSQERLARLIGVSLYTLHRWKTGKSRPSYLARAQIERALKELREEGQ
jgi:DNA-binding transcriptional regulator YiaG